MKIIDAFMFFDELELLEIRLNELDPIVDYFVIVESLERHGSDKPKPAFIQDNWDVVKPFESKIKYVLLPHLEPAYTNSASGWQRENYQRNILMDHVLEISTTPDEDILIVSDADEIPRASAIKDNLPTIRKEGLHRLSLELFFYNINRFVGLSCDGAGFPIIGPVSHFQRGGMMQFTPDRISTGLSAIRGLRWNTIPNGGWHFSYFGGSIDRMRNKVASFAESLHPLVTPFHSRTDAEIALDISTGDDIYHRGIYPGAFTLRETDDPKLPVYFLNNTEKYNHFTEDFFKKQNGLA
jgi:beta-1,4-mannosyl-glycoprotein beta-1,4-N-acetylglucosaminyltransferase